MSRKFAFIIFFILPITVMSQAIWNGDANTSWYNAQESEFTIILAQSLAGLAVLVSQGNDFSGKTVKLGQNIMLNDTTNWQNWKNEVPKGIRTWTGGDSSSFNGTFDGNGFVINGVYINDTGSNQGLFRHVGSNGIIKNLGVKASYIKGDSSVGGLVGLNDGNIISNSYFIGTVEGTGSSVGGLVGFGRKNETINNSYFVGTVNGAGDHVGGLIGFDYNNSAINSSYFAGTVNGAGNDVGGLVGYAPNSFMISDSYVTGTINGIGNNVGGLVGCGGITINNSYSTVLVKGAGRVGGLVGYKYRGTISNSSFYGNVEGMGDYVGGLVGHDLYDNISNSYSAGKVEGEGSYVGGLIGYKVGDTISNSYSTVLVKGAGDYVGGLVGKSVDKISNSYSTGAVTGMGNYVGGFAGDAIHAKVSISNSYYNTQTSGQIDIGIGTGTGKTTAQMKQRATFKGWDFDEIWSIEEGEYPLLKTFLNQSRVFILDKEIEPEYLYTGTQIKPEPKITWQVNNALLKKDVDYVLSYGANKNVGIGTVTIHGINNYSGLLETIPFEIIRKHIAISITAAQNKFYDGTTAATITGVLEGVSEKDDVSFNGNGTFASKDVGDSITIFPNVTLNGTDAKNYILVQPANLIANIIPKPLTITLNPKTITITASDFISKFKDYLIYEGLAAGDSSNIITGTIVLLYEGSRILAPPRIGVYPITLSGARTADNYLISYDNMELFLNVVSSEETPIIANSSISNIHIQTTSNQIILRNLPQTANVEVYNMQGRRIYSTTNRSALAANLTIPIHAKGIYIVKIGSAGILRVVAR